MNRRQAITAVGVGGILACAASVTAGAADDRAKAAPAGEKAVLFKVKNVTLDAVDGDKRTVAVSFGPADARVKLTGLPLAKDIRLVGWFTSPSIANNLPFEMHRLKELVGKKMSMRLRAEENGLAVDAIAFGDD